ncbi:type II secretion system protein N [Marinobacter sp. ELB17]|uniref:type II secretion system protein N n=1 Tax=Marinobacter sp. ELB17 TaxID=270374 RepID=UPI001D0CE6AE|nr:type II secretion system protein N [Marinobacter sp. ELB17]
MTDSFKTRLASWLLLVLVIYAAVSVAQITWLLAWPEQSVSRPTQANAVATDSHHTLTSVANYPLFGSPTKSQGPPMSVKRRAQETGLRLQLSGVMVGEQPERSSAIVAQDNGDTAYYRIGDALPGNAELIEVEASHILILRNGRYETLTFDDPLLGSGITEVVEQTKQPVKSAEKFLSDTKAKLDNQGEAALAPFGLRPTEAGADGYVYDGSNAMLNAVHLEAGDVIAAINGQALGTIDKDKTLLDNWRKQPLLNIEVQRNGRSLIVSYAIPEQWM